MRQFSLTDRLLAEADRALRITHAPADSPGRASPASNHEQAALSDEERRHVAGLMRINHAGEVAAQGLYFGQASVARDPDLRKHLLSAAAEEADHLAWCEMRLTELGARASIASPLWYGGAFAIGALAGTLGDRLSLGFVVETERQVESHLGEHLRRLPDNDQATRAVLETMQCDEARHRENAVEHGAMSLPQPLPRLMQWAADLMRAVAYRF